MKRRRKKKNERREISEKLFSWERSEKDCREGEEGAEVTRKRKGIKDANRPFTAPRQFVTGKKTAHGMTDD